MNAAVYARKSTDQAGLPEWERSVESQIEAARAYAARKRWTVSDAHVYRDDGISGAEFSRRPGFSSLMAAVALIPRPFDVLLIRDEDRLGREAIDTLSALKTIQLAGVRVVAYADDREVELGSMQANIMTFMRAEFAAEERRKASTRTAEAMRRRAERGLVTGGTVFGYDTAACDTGGRVRVINAEEAAIVRQMFDLYLAGHGVRGIAKHLNQLGAPCPRSQQGRASGWSGTSVWALLQRPIYHGEIIWNKTRKRDRWGQQHQTPRPEREWIRVPVPALRIVDEEIWSAVQARREAARRSYLVATGGERFGRPANARESKYLLTGLTRCASCGHALIVMSRSHRSRRAYFYRCGGFHSKGSAICSNNLHLPLEAVDDAILAEIEGYVLHPQVVTRAVEIALDALQPPARRVEVERKP